MKTIKKEKNNSSVRVILNIPEELYETFSQLALKRGLTKSNMIIYSMSWFLDYNKSLDIMPKLIDFIRLNPDELSSKDLN